MSQGSVCRNTAVNIIGISRVRLQGYKEEELEEELPKAREHEAHTSRAALVGATK